jgi:hypothetical protein
LNERFFTALHLPLARRLALVQPYMLEQHEMERLEGDIRRTTIDQSALHLLEAHFADEPQERLRTLECRARRREELEAIIACAHVEQYGTAIGVDAGRAAAAEMALLAAAEPVHARYDSHPGYQAYALDSASYSSAAAAYAADATQLTPRAAANGIHMHIPPPPPQSTEMYF